MKNKLIGIVFIMLLFLPMCENLLKAEETTSIEEEITKESTIDEESTTNKNNTADKEKTDKEKEDLKKINEELEKQNEELEKEKEITDNAKKELEENQDEIEQLQKDLVQSNKELEVLKQNLYSVKVQTTKLLKILQKFNNNNTAVIVYNQLIDSNSLEEFITKIRGLEILSQEANKVIQELLIDLQELKKEQDEIAQKSLHLEKVSANLEKQIAKYSDNIEVSVNPLEAISSNYFLSECKADEVYGVDCGKDLKEEKEFDFPIINGSVTNEFGGWDALEQSDGHTGIDMIGDEEIHPIAGGEVEEVTVDAYGGIQVMMIHNVKGVNYITNYAHLSKVNVVPGDILTTDDVLGEMGQTGIATGVHLHLEVIEGPYYIHSQLENPREYIDFPPLYIEFTKEEEKDE